MLPMTTPTRRVARLNPSCPHFLSVVLPLCLLLPACQFTEHPEHNTTEEASYFSPKSEKLEERVYYKSEKSVESDSFDMDCIEGACQLTEAHGWSHFSDPEAVRAALASNISSHSVAPHSQALSFSEQLQGAKTAINNIITTRQPDDLVVVAVRLQDNPERLQELRSLNDANRQRWINNRKEQIKPVQDRVSLAIEVLGGTVHSRSWLVNDLITEISVENLNKLYSIPDVIGVFPGTAQVAPSSFFTGDSARIGTLAADLLETGYGGLSGSSTSTGRTRVGILEYDSPVVCNSPNWKTPGGANRLRHAGVCRLICSSKGTHDSKVCTTSAPASPDNHGTVVTWVAGGGIEGGQHSSYPGSNTSSQRMRSGVAQDSALYYTTFRDGTFNSIACAARRGFENLVEQGVDIINMSWGFESSDQWCNPSYNYCNLNEAIINAHAAGVISVAAAGNEGGGGVCSVSYPASHPNVLSVGSLRASNTGGYDYRDSARPTYSSNGYYFANYFGSNSTTRIPIVDILAPGEYRYWPTSQTGYNSSQAILGTSFASPHVAGMLAQTREWLHDIGASSTANDPFRVQNHILLYGDGYTGSATNPNAYNRYTVSHLSGFGRVRGFWRHRDSLGNSWSFRNRKKTITQGQTYEFDLSSYLPLNSNYTGAKLALSFLHNSPSIPIPEINFRVVDKCPTGGGTQVIQTATKANGVKKRIRLDDSTNQIEGRCLFAQVIGENIPSGGVTVYIGAILFSDDPDKF